MRKCVAMLAVGLAACGGMACGGMKVHRVQLSEPKVEGVRVQVPRRADVTIVTRTASGEPVVRQAPAISLPSITEAYDIGFRGAVFQSKSLDLKLHASGSLKEFSFSVKQRAAEGLASGADALTAVSKALEERRTAQGDAAKAKVAEADAAAERKNNLLTLEIVNRMLTANLAALERGAALPYPDAMK